MYYSPSASTAWSSVAYLQDQVTLGWFMNDYVDHLEHHLAQVLG